MEFNNRNNQKKHNSRQGHDNDNSQDENIIPEIIYDNFDDDRDESNLNHKSDNNSNHNSNNLNNNHNIDLNHDNFNIEDIDNIDDIDNKDIINAIKAFEDDTGNNDNHNQNNEELALKPVDVRIIVDGAGNSEFLSKAIKNIDMFDELNIVISSIITTTNVDMAKKAVIGSDIILIATDSDEDGKNLFLLFYDSLKTDLNYVEHLKFPKYRDLEITDIKSVETEIKNSIIRAGLASIFDIANINQLRSQIAKTNDELNDSQAFNEKLSLENDMLVDEAKELRKNNNNLKDEINNLQNNIDEIKLDFTDYKSRYSNIHSKKLLEIFLIRDLWFELFSEKLNDDKVDEIVIATNKFRPEDILVGQEYIGAVSKNDAVDWLKIVKTALIFVKNDNSELQEEMINYYKKKQDQDIYNNMLNYNSHEDNRLDKFNSLEDSRSDNINSHEDSRLDNHQNNRDYKEYSKNKTKNTPDDEEDEYDYATNQFQDFWDSQ